MNPFQFKIPESLKEDIKHNLSRLTVYYGSYEGKVCKRVTIDSFAFNKTETWYEAESNLPFEDWYKQIKW